MVGKSGVGPTRAAGVDVGALSVLLDGADMLHELLNNKKARTELRAICDEVAKARREKGLLGDLDAALAEAQKLVACTEDDHKIAKQALAKARRDAKLITERAQTKADATETELDRRSRQLKADRDECDRRAETLGREGERAAAMSAELNRQRDALKGEQAAVQGRAQRLAKFASEAANE